MTDSAPQTPSDPTKPGGQSTGPSAFDVIAPYLHPGRENVMLIYVLYLVGLIPAFGVVPIIIGFVMALLNRQTTPGRLGQPLRVSVPPGRGRPRFRHRVVHSGVRADRIHRVHSAGDLVDRALGEGAAAGESRHADRRPALL